MRQGLYESIGTLFTKLLSPQLACDHKGIVEIKSREFDYFCNGCAHKVAKAITGVLIACAQSAAWSAHVNTLGARVNTFCEEILKNNAEFNLSTRLEAVLLQVVQRTLEHCDGRVEDRARVLVRLVFAFRTHLQILFNTGGDILVTLLSRSSSSRRLNRRTWQALAMALCVGSACAREKTGADDAWHAMHMAIERNPALADLMLELISSKNIPDDDACRIVTFLASLPRRRRQSKKPRR